MTALTLPSVLASPLFVFMRGLGPPKSIQSKRTQRRSIFVNIPSPRSRISGVFG